MEKLKLYKIAIALLLALNLATLAFMWLNRPPHPGQKGPYQFLVKATDMDESQQAAYTQLRDAHRSKMDELRAKNSHIRRKLFNLLAQKDQNDPEVLLLTDSIAVVKRQEELLTFEHFRRVREICRPEQQAKFDAAIGEAIQSMGPPRR
jgi:Spy/CpxP family protein refolding chaperone